MHAGGPRRGVAVVLEDVPAAEHESSRPASGTTSLIFGERPSVRLPRRIGAHLRQRADRLGESLANGEDAGDGRGADRAEADEQHAEFAARGSNFNRCRHGRELYQLSCTRLSAFADVSLR